MGGVVGVTLGAEMLLGASNETAQVSISSKLHQMPWPYKPLDPEVIGQRAFESFKKGDCMYGAFEAIAGATADQLGSPYTDFPFMMFRFGAGGINGWGTVCGALSGAAAAFQLFSPAPGPLIDSLFAWYEAEPLPNIKPTGMKFPQVHSVSTTPLCHSSVSNWCKASGKKTYSPERVERCATIAASVAVKGVQLLNDQVAKKPVLAVFPRETKDCMQCHERGGVLENTRGKMDCGGCHSQRIGKHP
jgi:hypothetical protein